MLHGDSVYVCMYACMYVSNATGMQTYFLRTWHCCHARAVEPEHAIQQRWSEAVMIREHSNTAEW